MSPPPEDALHAALRTVIDPEVGLDVLTMGLIYRITSREPDLDVEMTLTTPGCPMGDYLTGEVREALASIPGVRDVNVTLVFDPPWDPSMIAGDVGDRS
jgi:metal-sulfur cluster biosynthetic enzyme